MNADRSLVEQIADAVLYEGYILYPYRPSVKSRQRWTFGGLYPRTYSEAGGGSDPWSMRTECLVRGKSETTLNVSVRFLQVVARVVERLDHPSPVGVNLDQAPRRIVESLRAGDEVHYTWQEAEERTVNAADSTLATLVASPHRVEFAFEAVCDRRPLHDSSGMVVGLVTREQRRIEGEVEISAAAVAEGIFRVGVTIRNRTPIAIESDRDEAQLRGLISTHAVLCVRDGGFVSQTDPADDLKELAAGCRNVGAWPVLVGEEGATDTVLAAPIILYDYPRIAPESPGGLFDSTEIDEILSLRIMTLTDDEKQAMAAVDGRTRAVLERTESLAREQLMGLHGTMRDAEGKQRSSAHDSTRGARS